MRKQLTEVELIVEARKAAPLYGNDWGWLLIEMANALERHVIKATKE